MLENFPRVNLAVREGRFSALGSPDEWDISPEDAWEVRDYCVYVLAFYRENGVGGYPTRDDVHFFEQTIAKIDSMLHGGGWLWTRPDALEEDILAGRQLTFDID